MCTCEFLELNSGTAMGYDSHLYQRLTLIPRNGGVTATYLEASALVLNKRLETDITASCDRSPNEMFYLQFKNLIDSGKCISEFL
jgi:hypothetical protein